MGDVRYASLWKGSNMKSRLLLLVSIVLGFPEWSSGGPPAADSARMPDVVSYEAMDVAPFNQELAAAVKDGASWAREPMQVVLRRAGIRDELPRHFVWTMENPAIENPRLLRATILAEGLRDDSISGEWIQFELEKSSDGTWHLTWEHRAWRCARGAHVGTYEKTPCP